MPGTRKYRKQDPEALRRDAEKKLVTLKERTAITEDRTPDEVIHELQVHQVELEMQNDALREAHLALELSWDKYIDLYEFAPVGYLTLGKTAIIEDANLTAASMFGTDRHDLVRARFRKFVDPADLEHWDRFFISVLRNAEKKTCDLLLLKKDGTRFCARVESLRIDMGLKKTVVRMAISDISREKLAEQELIRRSNEADAANVKLTATGDELRRNQALLTVSLEEKNVLLAEIHHRVKNNLAAFISLLSLDGAYEDTDRGRQLKTDLQNRARSMALIHETLYKSRDFSNVDMEFYLTTLVDQLAGSYAGREDIHTVVEAHGIILDLSRATTAGLIVNELITNSYKYAFPPGFDCPAVRGEPCTIRVALTLQDGSLVLSVSDNGRGLPPGLDPLSSKTLGLHLVNFLARHQLRAQTCVIEDKGTEFVFRMDAKAEAP
jgi:PAS domain S-box-containing protein